MIEVEETVIACFLIESKAVELHINSLESEDFKSDKLKEIFNAMKSLYLNGITADLLTVSQDLRKNGKLESCGGLKYLTKLVTIVNSDVNISQYIAILKENKLRRVLHEFAKDMLSISADQTKDIFDSFAISNKFLAEWDRRTASKDERLIKKLIEIQDATHAIWDGKQSNETFYLKELHEFGSFLGHFERSDYIVLAARPSMGKTAFALQLMLDLALRYNCIFVSLETSIRKLVNRMACNLAEVPVSITKIENFINGEYKKKYDDAMAYISNLNIINIFDSAEYFSMDKLRMNLKILDAQKKIDFVFIDYLQLAQTNDKDEFTKVTNISKGIKYLTKEINACVIALSQLSRANESRPDKRPKLSDLRMSGQIEQDADKVIFLHREHYYNKEADDVCELVVAKNKESGTGTYYMTFEEKIMKFKEIDSININAPF